MIVYLTVVMLLSRLNFYGEIMAAVSICVNFEGNLRYNRKTIEKLIYKGSLDYNTAIITGVNLKVQNFVQSIDFPILCGESEQFQVRVCDDFKGSNNSLELFLRTSEIVQDLEGSGPSLLHDLDIDGIAVEERTIPIPIEEECLAEAHNHYAVVITYRNSNEINGCILPFHV